MKLTVAYFRSSTILQENSVPMQDRMAVNYAVAHQLTIDKRYIDEGISARKKDTSERPGMYQLLQDIRSHQIGVILVYKRDRLARRADEYMQFYRLCWKYGIEIRFTAANEFPVQYTSLGEFVELIMAGMVEHEGDQIAERFRETQISNFLSKKKAGSLPYGIQAVADANGEITRLKYIDEDLKNDIQNIYTDADNWDSSRPFSEFVSLINSKYARRRTRKRKSDLGEELTDDDEKSSKWTNGNIKNLLTSSLFKGLHQKVWEGGARFEVERAEVAIIDPQQWDRVQGSMSRYWYDDQRLPPDHMFLLEGLCTCKEHGVLLVSSTRWLRGQKKYRYNYRCPEKNCRVVQDAKILETIILQSIERFMDLYFRKNETKWFSQYARDQKRKITQHLQYVKRVLAEKQVLFEHAVSTYLQSADQSEMAKMILYSNQVERWIHKQHHFESLLYQFDAFPHRKDRASQVLKSVRTELLNVDFEKRRQLLRDIVSKIECDGKHEDNISAVFRYPFREEEAL